MLPLIKKRPKPKGLPAKPFKNLNFGALAIGAQTFPKRKGKALALAVGGSTSQSLDERPLLPTPDSPPSNDGGCEPFTGFDDDPDDGFSLLTPLPESLYYARGKPAYTRYHANKQQSAERWRELLPSLLGAYLAVEDRTESFSRPIEVTYDCERAQCVHGTREVMLVGIKDAKKVAVDFCECYPLPRRLVLLGYLPCSPLLPNAAFEIHVVIQEHEHWLASPHAISGWATGMEGTFRAMGKGLKSGKSFFSESLLDSFLDESPLQKLASKCPACFGPRHSETDKRAGEADFNVCCDGNFQHKRYSHASRYDYRDSRPPIFLPAAKVEAMRAEVLAADSRPSASSVVDPCPGWKAAEGKDKREEHLDATGLFGMSCGDHDVLIYLIDIIQSGEKMHFALAAIKEVLDADPTARVGVLYDIACALLAHINKRQLFTSSERARLIFACSVFHAFAHIWLCQILFNPGLQVGWGRANGEGLERGWSKLAKLVALLRNSTPSHRLEAIHFRVSYCNEQSLQLMARHLRSSHKVSRLQFETSRTHLERLITHGSPPAGGTYSRSYFDAQWKKQREVQSPVAGQAGQKRKDLVEKKSLAAKLLLLRDKVRDQATKLATLLTGGLTTSFPNVEEWMGWQDQIIVLEQQMSPDLTEVLEGRSPVEGEHLLRVWERKRQMVDAVNNLRYIMQPFMEAKAGGRGSSVGHKASAKINRNAKSSRDKAVATIKDYNTAVSAMKVSCPPPHPLPIQLSEALAKGAADPFWSDDFFTDPREAWSSDPGTIEGISWKLREDRAEEALRRVGWETRRMMAWAQEREARLAAAASRLDVALSELKAEDWGDKYPR
ncbi:hypothetical protein RQP46_010840 [Phenoliferia psychrophenolica]